MKIFNYTMAGLVCLSMVSLCSCDDDSSEDKLKGLKNAITLSDEASSTITLGPKDTWASLRFVSLSNWTASVESEVPNWISLRETEGVGGYRSIGIITQEFLCQYYDGDPEPTEAQKQRKATISITCGATVQTVTVIQTAEVVKLLHGVDDIPDIDKFYLPAKTNEGFEGGAEGMKLSSSKYSWSRMKQSEHFFLFWEAGYGDDPNAESNGTRRVDVDDLLSKAEKYYQTNIEKLGMATVGQNKSNLDKYKMGIYLLYQDEWACYGGGYDNVIGALWVNHQPCQPAGSSVAHEVGHSFQYQTYCDQVLNGAADDLSTGFRYGFGPNGQGGCAYWEQCAQWQSFQDYPGEAYSQSWNLFTTNCHRHFNHEWMRYQSYWFQYYMVQKQGIASYGALWQKSHYPEDPADAYTRLYCGGDYEKFYDDYYAYASHALTYDFGAIQSYVPTDAYTKFQTTMLEVDGKYRPAYANCVGTIGFNPIRLNVPAAGSTVSVNLSALAVGSALAPNDGGVEIDVDGKSVATHTTYNDNVYDGRTYTESGFRFGFVAIKGNTATYGTMAKGTNGRAEMTLDDTYDALYLVVVATPGTYVHQYWNDKESDDLQWPYEVAFEGTSLYGSLDIDESAAPQDVNLSYTVRCTNLSEYPQGTLDLGISRELAQAFVLQPSAMKGMIQPVTYGNSVQPAEGSIVWGMLQSDGTLSYNGTANSGYYTDANGDVCQWANGKVYVEFDGLAIQYGQKPGANTAGETVVIRPVLIYTKDGKQYKATIQLTMEF